KEHALEQQQYLRKIRDVTANRVAHFSNLFQALAGSFSHANTATAQEEREKATDFFLSNVTVDTCQTCFLKERCWQKNFNKTYDYMQQIMSEVEEEPFIDNHYLQKAWNQYCIKPQKVVDAIHQEMNQFRV